MAFPQVASSATSSESTATTTHNVTLPSGLSNGDLCILIMAFDTDLSEPLPDLDGFTQLILRASGTFVNVGAYYRNCDGTEGSTADIGTTESVTSAHIALRITGHDSGTNPEVSTGAVSNSSSPNPDSLTPTSGAKDYLWIAAAGNNDDTTTSAYPYADNNLTKVSGSGSNQCNVMACTDELNQASEDPGAFTIGAVERWAAFTIAVHPGGVAYEIDCDAGSYAITGIAVNLLHDKEIDAAIGSYAVSGIVADLLHDKEIDVDGGSYAVSGIDVTLLHDKEIDLDQGSYAVSGTDVNLLYGRKLSAEGSSYAVTGIDVNLRIGYGILAEQGSYSISGIAVTLLKTKILEAALGTYAVTGLDVTLSKGRTLSAEGGSYAISGIAVNLLMDWVLSAEAGSYSVSGIALDLLYGRTILAELGTYDITGIAVNLLVDRILSAEAGSYSVTGIDVNLIYTPVSGAIIYGKRLHKFMTMHMN